MDYTSFYVWVDGLSLIVPRPGEESRLFAFTGPFQPSVSIIAYTGIIFANYYFFTASGYQVWLGILISIIFVVGMMTLFTRFYKTLPASNSEEENLKIKQKTSSYLGSYMIYIVNIMTNQGNKNLKTVDHHLVSLTELCKMFREL
jgi:H+/gluconate symporter-like permease